MTGKKVLAKRTVHAYPFKHRCELHTFSDERPGKGRCSFCDQQAEFIEYDRFTSSGHGSGVGFYALCGTHVRQSYPALEGVPCRA